MASLAARLDERVVVELLPPGKVDESCPGREDRPQPAEYGTRQEPPAEREQPEPAEASEYPRQDEQPKPATCQRPAGKLEPRPTWLGSKRLLSAGFVHPLLTQVRRKEVRDAVLDGVAFPALPTYQPAAYDLALPLLFGLKLEFAFAQWADEDLEEVGTHERIVQRDAVTRLCPLNLPPSRRKVEDISRWSASLWTGCPLSSWWVSLC